MNTGQERERNQAFFRQIQQTLGRTYPPGRFVAIAEGRIVADADGLDALRSLLQTMGRDPGQVLVVQAGVDHPETAVILGQVPQP